MAAERREGEMSKAERIREHVRKRYGQFASKRSTCCPGSCCAGDTAEQAKAIGYTDDDLRAIPPEAAAMGLGCGNPAALAGIKEGEVVLDLGSGGGIDVFLAARRVGASGRVIGVDMTDEMVEKAQATALRHGYKNVEFRKGQIEGLPVEDQSVDVIISNCVVNLAPDKLAVYKEAFRILRDDGRLLIADLVTDGEIPEDVRKSFDAWAGCIAGALERQEYLETIRRAGFADVRIVREHAYGEPDMDERLAGKLVSVQVEARKTTG
jgi:SAM-dependent methyltransferase